ncbi:MAG TPA: DUF559 domain-containing protein [Mycobacteriales bacterium]|nr:DUF559 domain-containing protein [Mycobacteriales bacterium]
MLGNGCRSELELLGFTYIFSDPRLPKPRLQVPVTAGGRQYFVDVAWPEVLLAVELDGAAYHGSADAREHDLRRDADLARIGWLTVRITYERLISEPQTILEELAGIIAVRRAQLGRAS